MARSDPQVNIRMPQALKDRLEDLAKTAGRSLNSEIVTRLQASTNERDLTGKPSPSTLAGDIASAINDASVGYFEEPTGFVISVTVEPKK